MTATLRLAVVSSVVLMTLACSGATPTEAPPLAVRLVDLFDAKRVQGSVKPATTARPTIWRFDGTPLPPTAKFAATRRLGAGARGRRSHRQGRSADRTRDDRRCPHSPRADLRSRCSGHASRHRGQDARVPRRQHFDSDVTRGDRQPGRSLCGGANDCRGRWSRPLLRAMRSRRTS